MEAIEIARKLAELGQTKEACKAYTLAIHQDNGQDPAGLLEAAAYVLQNGGDYRISYSCFKELYNRGHFREDVLPLMYAVFYEPNIKMLKARYERNCKRLAKYPYLFRRDFVPFEELPIQFFPYDDHNGYVPFYRGPERFGEFVNFSNTVVSRNFFKDLDKPILAEDVFSQYELEYLNDNVRRSEDIGRENHVYLHYTDWGVFCSYLQCLNVRKLLESRKLVFLIEDEIGQYPIDFKERFGLDYSQYPVKPIGVREVNRLIWHTQLSTHNGGDFFNEIFDAHPNLLCMPSLLMSNVEEELEKLRAGLAGCGSVREALQVAADAGWPGYLMEELYHMRDRTDKDLMAAVFLSDKAASRYTRADSRISPALFFQPHFYNIIYKLRVDSANRTVLEAENYEQIHQSSIFRNFKYIKTFTPMRRFTSSHGASVRFMYAMAEQAEDQEKGVTKTVVSDAVMERVLNRSFMIDPEDRLYKDGVLVRLEDGKLNPKATLRALAAFLDLPYDEMMEVCTENGEPVRVTDDGYAPGFSPDVIYRTYDEYANDDERYFIEYFLRDAYEYYGYDFHFYDGAPVDEAKCAQLIDGFTTIDHYMKETWIKVFREAEVSAEGGERVDGELERQIQEQLLESHMEGFKNNRISSAKILLEGLRFVNRNGQPLHMMPMLQLDPAMLEQPLYH